MTAITATEVSPFRLPEVRAMILIRLLGGLMFGALAVTAGYQIYQLTKDAFALGILGLVEAIPAIGFALLGGHVADRWERRGVLLKTESVFVVLALAFALITFLPRASYTLFVFYGLVFLAGVVSGFSRPAWTALEAQVVPAEHAARSQSWLSGFSQVGMIAGPALGGVSLDFLGVGPTYLLISLLAISVVYFVWTIQPKPLPPVEQHESLRESVAVGVRYVAGNQLLIASMALDLFAVLFGGAMALLPVFAEEVLQVGASGLGLLRTAPSIGALLIMVITSRRPITRNAGWWLLGNVAAFGVAFITFGLSTNFWLSLAMLFLTGIFDGVSMVVRMLILRFESPEHLRGRVAAVQWIFIGASNEIGAFESGVAAKLLGTVPSVVVGGVVTLLVVAATTLLAPKLRNLHFDADRLAAG